MIKNPYHDTAIYSCQLFRDFTDSEIKLIKTSFPSLSKIYDKGEIILNQGDYTRHVGIIIEGRLICCKYHYDGSSQLLQLLGRGDFIGLEAISSSYLTSPYTIISDDFSTVAVFPYIDFLASPEIDEKMKLHLMGNVLNIVADDIIRKMYKIDVLSKRTLQERVLTYLSIISEKKKSRTIDIGMTQEQFAYYLCVNRSVLSKELNKMKRNRLIDFKGSVYTINGSADTLSYED